jgi:hypothetical protein
VNSGRSALTNRVHRKIRDFGIVSNATRLRLLAWPLYVVLPELLWAAGFALYRSWDNLGGTPASAPTVEPPTRITSNTEAAIQVWTSSANARWAAKPAWAAGMASKNTLLAQQYAQPVEATVKLIQDPVITEYVNRVSQNLVHNSGLAGSVHNLLVLNLLVLNCFRRSLPI